MKEEEIVQVLGEISRNLDRIASALENAVNAPATQSMVTKPMVTVTIVRKHSYGRKSRK